MADYTDEEMENKRLKEENSLKPCDYKEMAAASTDVPNEILSPGTMSTVYLSPTESNSFSTTPTLELDGNDQESYHLGVEYQSDECKVLNVVGIYFLSHPF